MKKETSYVIVHALLEYAANVQQPLVGTVKELVEHQLVEHQLVEIEVTKFALTS